MDRAIQIFAAVVALTLVVWLIWACIADAIDNVRNAASVLPDETTDEETEQKEEKPAWRLTK